jgi:hypothetical protein
MDNPPVGKEEEDTHPVAIKGEVKVDFPQTNSELLVKRHDYRPQMN